MCAINSGFLCHNDGVRAGKRALMQAFGLKPRDERSGGFYRQRDDGSGAQREILSADQRAQ